MRFLLVWQMRVNHKSLSVISMICSCSCIFIAFIPMSQFDDVYLSRGYLFVCLFIFCFLWNPFMRVVFHKHSLLLLFAPTNLVQMPEYGAIKRNNCTRRRKIGLTHWFSCWKRHTHTACFEVIVPLHSEENWLYSQLYWCKRKLCWIFCVDFAIATTATTKNRINFHSIFT